MTFLDEHTSTSYPTFPTTPRELNVYDKLQVASLEPKFKGTYRSLVGGVLYLFMCTRLDIGFSVSILTQHLADPRQSHFAMWHKECCVTSWEQKL